ncbi:ComEA family DNA-binding protein [Nonomuraea longicatena]
MVHVTGKVRTPGVYTLPAGARVTDALKAAGGLRDGAHPGVLNLARRLLDGEQLAVGTKPASQPPGAITTSPLDPTATVIDLNTATIAQLEQLPGVGEVLATRIATYRDTQGGFRSIDQLKEVSGIGDRKFADLKDKVRI